MNIIKTFLSLIGLSTCQFINNVIFPHRPVYISKLISDEHRESIHIAMDQLALKETENKTENHIRIQYDNYNGGGVLMTASSHTDGYFEVYQTVIGMNRMLDIFMFQCVVLHELCHSYGLGHTDYGIMKPIINFTENYCHLSIFDIINLYDAGFYAA